MPSGFDGDTPALSGGNVRMQARLSLNVSAQEAIDLVTGPPSFRGPIFNKWSSLSHS